MSTIKEPERPQLPDGWTWQWLNDEIAAVGTDGKYKYQVGWCRTGERLGFALHLAPAKGDEVRAIVAEYGRTLWPENPPIYGVKSALERIRHEQAWAAHQADVAAAESAFHMALYEHVRESEEPFKLAELVREETVERALAELKLGGWDASLAIDQGQRIIVFGDVPE